MLAREFPDKDTAGTFLLLPLFTPPWDVSLAKRKLSVHFNPYCLLKQTVALQGLAQNVLLTGDLGLEPETSCT